MIGGALSMVGRWTQTKLWLVLFGMMFEAALAGLGFVLSVPVIHALLTGDIAAAQRALASLLSVLLAYAVTRYILQLVGYRKAIDLGRDLFNLLARHLAILPMCWFTPARISEVSQLTSQGIMTVLSIPAHLMRAVIGAVVTPLTVLLGLLWFDWRLALSMILCVPFLMLSQRWIARRVEVTDAAMVRCDQALEARLIEFSDTQAALRLFPPSRGADPLSQAAAARITMKRAQLRRIAPSFVSFVLLIQMAFVVVIGTGTHLTLGGEIEAALLIALLALVVRHIEPLITAADISGSLRVAQNALSALSEVLSTAPLPEPQVSRKPQDHSVTFRNVTFAYDSAPVLNELSFHVPQGQFAVLTGPSGAGKSTALRLMLRFWDVTAGGVQIGGVDLRDLSSAELMRHVSVVFQDVYLFDGTIRDNILLGDPMASDASLASAIRHAQLLEVIDRLPKRLNTPVGPLGARLSQGERRRVAIARAMLKDAPIILLDEVTASLDAVNEAAVARAIKALAQTKTVIAVTHGDALVACADQRIVLS